MFIPTVPPKGYKPTRGLWVIGVVILALGGWFVWNSTGKSPSPALAAAPLPVAPTPTVNNTTIAPPAALSTALALTPSLTQTPNATLEPVAKPAAAWKPADEDQKYLEGEMAALPPGSYVTDLPFNAYPSLPEALAANGVMSLPEKDKYTARIGKDRKKIIKVETSAQSLKLTLRDQSELGALLGHTSEWEINWLDLEIIHCDKIKFFKKHAPVQTIYQVGLVVYNQKQPLTVQCVDPDDLGNLVASLEYWAKASASHYEAPVVSMPYLEQGLRLDDGGQVTALWADTPAEKAGVKLGDVVWRLDQDSDEKESRGDLEGALQNLTSGPHDMFIVTPKGFLKGKVQMVLMKTNIFKPKRRKLSLLAP